MAQALVRAQKSPAASTVDDLYTVPGATMTTSSTIAVCNRNSTKVKFRIAISPLGVADSVEHYLYYDVELLPNDTFAATLGVTLIAADKVRVWASSTGVNFHFFGAEIS